MARALTLGFACLAAVLLLLAGCSHPATDAETAAADKAFTDCVWTSTTQLDDGKSDPVSVAYGIEPSCAVQSNQAMELFLKGARTDAGVLARRQMWKDGELKVVVSAILIYRKSQAQRASPSPLPPAAADLANNAWEAEERKDYATAARVWRSLADQGNAAAQVRLGTLYDYGLGVPKDYAEAARWFRKAANQGVAEAQASLGYRYENGLGVPKDYAEAARWVRMAAEQGIALAQVDLALMYDDGHGVPRDYTEAARWLRMAAEQGDAGAQDILGGMCFLGEGVPRDYVQSYMWLSLAVAGGWQGAAPNRDKLEQLMTPEQIAEAQQRTAAWQKAHARQ